VITGKFFSPVVVMELPLTYIISGISSFEYQVCLMFEHVSLCSINISFAFDVHRRVFSFSSLE
jgi:hypothetical protein